ncbi:histidine kinase [Pseudomonas sp. PIC25]|uniref:response regulator n=1 Tax=Pseudomonas sp. PIC25 TaxID=1958773 RepID=UPI000BABEF04|nr:response regulator [Pseudomonas sp. PIC25]PAU65136.1 histidine kinase [Pseudomonas sp. PIC25]
MEFRGWLMVGLVWLCFAVSAAERMDLTAEEQAWVDAHPVVRVGMSRGGWPPFDIVDEQGRHGGISADYLAALGRRIGLHFDLVLVDGWDEALEALASGRVDLLPSVAYSPERERRLLFSDAYLRSRNLIFVRQDSPVQSLKDLSGKRVAVERGFVLRQMVDEQVSGVAFVETADTEQALRLVSSGKADAYVGNMTVASYLIRQHNLTNLELRGETGIQTGDLHFAVRRDWPELVELMDRALAALDEQERQAIRDRWLPPLTEFNWRKALEVAWPFAGGLLLLIASMLYWNRRLRVQIRERQRAEAEARRQRSVLLALVNAIPDPICYKDADGRYLGANQAYVTLLGRPLEALLGRRDQELGDGAAWASGTAEADESWAQYPDGRRVLLDTQRAAFHDESGELLGSVSVSHDVTARKQTEQALARAKALAEEAARLKSDFLANMSHEIRTPLNAIIGMAHLALQTSPNPRQRDYLNKIQQAGQHLLRVIDDILTFSRAEAGKLAIERIEFGLQSLLDDLVNMVGPKLAAKRLELLFNLDDRLPGRLLGDPLRIGQILINYVNNAIKFTEHGEIEVILRAERQGERDLLLYLGVRDTGIGLDPEQQRQLFQPFQQGDSSITRQFGGSGLGLAICKRLAEAMGGSVGVESRLGEGSLFWCRLPLGVALSSQPLLPRLSVRGSRVLVVDDNDSARRLLGEIFQSMGFRVATEASGTLAVQRIQEAAAKGTAFDLVLLDWQMTELDGLETARRIVALGLRTPPRVVLVSAFGREEPPVAVELGISAVLAKPLTPTQLFEVALLCLSGAADQRSSRPPPTPPPLPSFAGQRVLLVEDNELNQLVARELLSESGLQVDVAENGAVALDLLQLHDEDHYALVLMDMQMPVLDGIGAARAIREQERFRHLPIVAMTANALPADRERCLEAGMDDHLGKPISPAELWTTLSRWLSTEEATIASAAVMPKAPGWGLPGVDVAAGLRLVGGREDLYRSQLSRFAASEKAFVARLRGALATGDRTTAARLLHTFKGLAAGLGADELRGRAVELETALEQGNDPAGLQPSIDALATRLEVLIDAIETRLAEAGKGQGTAAPETDLARLCARLAELCSADDPRAGKLLDEQAETLRSALNESYATIAEALHDYDFETALEALRVAARQRDISL